MDPSIVDGLVCAKALWSRVEEWIDTVRKRLGTPTSVVSIEGFSRGFDIRLETNQEWDTSHSLIYSSSRETKQWSSSDRTASASTSTDSRLTSCSSSVWHEWFEAIGNSRRNCESNIHLSPIEVSRDQWWCFLVSSSHSTRV